MGEPNRSHRMMVTNTENPRPMNSALPHGRACGAPTRGHSVNGPDSGRPAQEPLPPAQLLKPDWMSLMPIKATVGPVTNGGKIFFSTLGLVKERAISSRAQTDPVPIKAPYPRGQGSFVPSAAVGQYPVAYICANAPDAMGITVKEVPTTEIKPVPT